MLFLSHRARAVHVLVGVLVLLVLGAGLTAASQLAPQTTRLAAGAQVAAVPVVLPMPVPVRVTPVHRVPVVRPKAAAPKPAMKPALRRVVVQRAARVARRTPAPAPAFGQADAQRRGAAAYASLGRQVPAGWTMHFEAYRGTYQGLADSARKTITVWVRSSDTQSSLRITIAHEMGHVLDYTTLTDHDKGRYLSLRNRSDSAAPWYPRNGTSDYASPAGDFAEVYAVYLAGAGDFRSTFAPQPTSSQLAALSSYFSDLQARQA